MDGLSSIIGETPQETPAPAPTPEASDAPQVAQAAPAEQAPQQEAEPAPKMIPYQAVLEERRLRQQERAQREEMERRVEARLAEIQRSMQAPAPAAPDPSADPVGFLAHQQQSIAQRVDHLVQQSQQSAQQAQVAQLEAQLANRVIQAETVFKAANPDYEKALTHVHTLRVKELQVLGVDELTAQQQSAQELKQAAYVHAAQGRNPAEVIYGLAKVRGYSAKPQVTPAEQMQMAQKGAAASQSLGGGGATTGKLDARALLAMSDEEFAAATKGGKWKEIMGG